MLQALAATTVDDIKTRAPVLVALDDRVGATVEQMREQNRGGCIIQDADGRVAGIFTQHDVRTRIDLEDPAWIERRMGDVMTSEPKCIGADRALADALAIMVECGCRSLPVVDEDEHALGVISIRDILSHVADNFPQEFLNLPPDPTLEARKRYGG